MSVTPNVNKRQNEPVKTQSLFAKLMRMDGMNAVVAKAAEIHPVRAEMSCQLVSILARRASRRGFDVQISEESDSARGELTSSSGCR